MMPATFGSCVDAEMQLLAPELQEIKERYKDDKQRQQEEMMKLYRAKGINPFASCLPLLLQLPVFISLFYMLRTDLKKHICGPTSSNTTTRCTTRRSRASRICRPNTSKARARAWTRIGVVPLRARHHGEGDGRRADRDDSAVSGFAGDLDAADDRRAPNRASAG